jgi:ligand-binding sensor domain-containing protein/AraC-like DNA-binding protein
MTKRLLLAIVMMLSITVSAQRVPLRIMSQTPVQGTEEARSLMFDHYGLMWVGTDQGLRVFDGYAFKTFRSDAYSPGIIPNNYVRSITEDHNDGLWIGTRDGLARYDRRKGTFKTYHLRGEQARLISALYTTSDGTVWAGTNAGVSRYDATIDDFIDINMPQAAISFAEDRHGNLYIGTWEGGLLRLNKKTGRMVSYPRLSERNTAQTLLMDSRGRLWVGTWEHGIVRLDHPENEQSPVMHWMNEGRRDFRTFHRLVEDSVSHSVWGCCIEGLTRVDIDDYTQVDNYPILTFCYDMITDGMGNLWVITRNQGIVHLSTRQSPFRFFHLDPAGLELPVNRIQTVFTADGNRFWLGLQPYGLALYERSSGQVAYNTQISGMAQMTGPQGIYVQTISDIQQQPDGSVWMASSHGIVVWKDGEPSRHLSRSSMPYISDEEVKAFHKLPSGAMLVGQTNGLGIALSEEKGRMLSLTEDGRDFSRCNVQAVFEDHGHRLWIATEGEGIICITGRLDQPKSYSCHQYAPACNNYPIDEATAVYEDQAHRLWAISASGGLFLYNDETDTFLPVNHLYHIGTGGLYSIQGDDTGAIWLSTDKGLVRLMLSGKHATTTYYNMEDGIEAIRFSPNGAFHYGNELFYGSATGFFSFDAAQTERWQQGRMPSLVVTDLLIDDHTYLWLDSVRRQTISPNTPFFTREITIPSDVRKFSVEFSLLAYQNQEQCRYTYRLEGYDRDWHNTDAENRRATYQNLPAGSYELKLRAYDSYGRLVELPYSIHVRVLPPWYLTWWAYLIYFVLLIAAVYGVKEWYKARVNRRARLQQRVSELLHYRELMVIRQYEGARKALEAEEQQHSSPDELFLSKAIDCVKQHLDDADYDREQFASDMCVSSSTLYNKLRALTDQNVTGFINSIRLKEACRILRQRPDIKMTELSMAVGFNTPKYFTKLFKKEFGVLPSEYAEQGGEI